MHNMTRLTGAAALLVTLGAAATSVHANEEARQLVLDGVEAAFHDRDAAALGQYFAEDYIQHNPTLPDGLAGLEALVEGLAGNPDFNFETHRVLADGDLVALHNTMTGAAPVPLVTFDIFRVADGLIVEHWDAAMPETPPNPSGRTLVDGPTEIEDHDRTEANRALVTEFVETVLINGQVEEAARFFDDGQYIQHNPDIADGLDGLGEAMEAMAEAGMALSVSQVHRVVAEGNFVLLQSEGQVGDQPLNIIDLFRVEDGNIAEHWDVFAPVPPPEEAMNDNGVF